MNANAREKVKLAQRALNVPPRTVYITLSAYEDSGGADPDYLKYLAGVYDNEYFKFAMFKLRENAIAQLQSAEKMEPLALGQALGYLQGVRAPLDYLKEARDALSDSVVAAVAA